MKGTVFDIKEFAIYDGPGVRQTVFFKGCPLRCAWCHNPEGLKATPELAVSTASCEKCAKCMGVCPSELFDKELMRAEPCSLCKKCIEVCPLGIRRVAGVEYTVYELAKKILSKADYYSKYGGGVTFSGGEPMLQSEFLIKLCEKLGDVHKAIETCGYTDEKTFRAVISGLDYVIMDIKCMDEQAHIKYTGRSNKPILENYRILRESGIAHTVRIHLIGSVSDSEENLEQTARCLSDDKYLDKVELLPYQVTAGAKYKSVGREYSLDFDPTPRKDIDLSVFEQYGIRSVIL